MAECRGHPEAGTGQGLVSACPPGLAAPWGPLGQVADLNPLSGYAGGTLGRSGVCSGRAKGNWTQPHTAASTTERPSHAHVGKGHADPALLGARSRRGRFSPALQGWVLSCHLRRPCRLQKVFAPGGPSLEAGGKSVGRTPGAGG